VREVRGGSDGAEERLGGVGWHARGGQRERKLEHEDGAELVSLVPAQPRVHVADIALGRVLVRPERQLRSRLTTGRLVLAAARLEHSAAGASHGEVDA